MKKTEKTFQSIKSDASKGQPVEQTADDRALPEIDEQELSSVTGAGVRQNAVA
jgi:hypothetical protein